jgi:hypothetical protein
MGIISYIVGIGTRGPIAEGEYAVGDRKVAVSYPTHLDIGLPAPLELPKSLSTVFAVSWDDPKGKVAARLRSRGFEQHLPTYDALDAISELLLAFKLVRIGHVDAGKLRAVGIDDTLFYFSVVDGAPSGDLSIRMGLSGRDYPWIGGGGQHPDDPDGTTELARPHIAASTFPVARRYVRCFELLEHGFYAEAFVIAFSVLDDLVQQMLHGLLEGRGMSSESEREDLLRGIKERRLRLYLGPLLRVVCGRSLADMWPAGERALDWLNKQRNNIAHNGERASYGMAAVGIFGCMKILTVLHQEGYVVAEFPVEMFRHAKLSAAWTENPPPWVPSGSIAEAMDFSS